MSAAAFAIDFAQGGNSAAFAVAGWSTPEPHGCWTDGYEAVLRLQLGAGHDYTLTLDCAPFATPTAPAAQRLAVVANGTTLLERTCTGPQHLTLDLPGSASGERGEVHLVFRCPDAVRACDHGVAYDGRRLAFAFGRICLTPRAAPEALASAMPLSWRISLPPTVSPPAAIRPRTGVTPQPRVAVVTMVYNEPLYLPIWLRHYGRQVGLENCYVIDHGSDDDQRADRPGCQMIRIPRSPYDPILQSTFASRFSASLLCWYDWVLFADVDEIVLADPSVAATLAEYCARDLPEVVNAIGLNVQQIPGTEEDFDPSRPVTMQRSWVFACSPMCKPLLIRRPVIWPGGAHSADAPVAFDHLYMFHLRWFDLRSGLLRLAKTRSMAWAHDQSGGHQRTPDKTFMSQFHGFAAMPRHPGVAFEPGTAPLRGFLEAVSASQKGRENDPYKIDLDIWWGELWEIPHRFRGLF